MGVTLFFLGPVKWIEWKYYEWHHQHSEYQAAHQRKEKIACSITLKENRITHCRDRIMLQRKDATKSISSGGHPTSRAYLSTHNNVQKSWSYFWTLETGVIKMFQNIQNLKEILTPWQNIYMPINIYTKRNDKQLILSVGIQFASMEIIQSNAR